ncbi:iron ABC transporter permease [Phenylobacterium sp.]|uniref:ABC transporter permease n=1 Tax=Phenylobacterium sp. TaxID=1871053 RepID=UPI00272F40DB|nr:iron ABC transporter permease [Phenylobacterium sp.]MDP2212889.1 iron ABC transporter permease [Phenylobacterium sp.]
MLALLASLAAVVALLPLVGVAAAALSGETAAIPARDILRYGATSAALAGLVAVLTGVVGSLAAWLVVMHRFPGRDIFAWALALPLAAPAFAVAYAYADLFDVAGGLRIWMRADLGFDLPFEMRTLPGAAFILSCAFYPYVYLAMRAAFVNQSAQALEAARALGCTPQQAFRRVALPLARPALAAGVALAVMETLADYGAVQFLSVQTLTTGVVRAWFVFGSLTSAAQFALPLLGAAALLLWIERWGRGGRGYENANARWRPLPVTSLRGGKAAAAAVFCFSLIGFGLLLPAGWLAFAFLDVTPDWPRLIQAGANSLTLATAGAVVTVALATGLALGSARVPHLARLASLGYATPGAVMAIGLLVPAAMVWRLAPGAAQGFGAGLILLVYAYAARLMAAALEPVDAGLSRVTPNMVLAARSLGRSEGGAAWTVQLPIARGALLTAGLVVFIDILKELPATLILRPFNFDTLAVIADNYARDERLANAGWPALLIVLIALPAVIWLTRKIAASRPGDPA